jgi:hypothetical protein
MEDNEEELKVLTKKEIKSCRHKAERRWYRRLVILNILIIAGVFEVNILRIVFLCLIVAGILGLKFTSA